MNNTRIKSERGFSFMFSILCGEKFSLKISISSKMFTREEGGHSDTIDHAEVAPARSSGESQENPSPTLPDEDED